MLDTLYPLKMTPLPGYSDADHNRPRPRNTRPSNAQYRLLIFLLVNPRFRLANLDLATRVCHLGFKPEVCRATVWPENASGAAMRMDTP